MELDKDHIRPENGSAGVRRRQPGRLRWTRGYVALLFAGAVLVAAQQNQQSGQQSSSNQPTGEGGPGRAWTSSGQVAIPVSQPGQQNFDAANTERRKQIADDSTRLLKLATDLKAEVDKTTKDTLSLNVIRKADEIEKLAHSVKEKMKLSGGAN